jgi:hypothetical protein
MPTKSLLPLLLLASPVALGGCAVVAGGVAAVVVTQEVLDNNTYVSYVNRDVSQVWPTVKVFLAEQSLELIEVDEAQRTAKAKIDGAKVTVSAETYDLDKSVVRVSASRYGVNDGEMARIVNERLVRRLELDG